MNILPLVLLPAALFFTRTVIAADGRADHLPPVEALSPPALPSDTVSAGEGIFDFFPDEAKVQDSENFVPENFLGYGFFHSARTVRYDSGELVFIIGLDSAAQTRQIAETYLRTIHQESDLAGTSVLDVVDPVHGPIALLLQGRFFCGVIGSRDREGSHWRVTLLRDRIVDMERAAVRANLPKQWRFSTGDDSRFSTPGFDDSGWKSIKAGAWWETQGYDGYDGIGWYRGKVIVPSALRRAASIGKTLLICLGRIDDNDTAYFNGIRIGHTEVAGPIRKYLVPCEIVNWDRENIIAVRVDDIGGAGGLGAGPYYIRAAASPDLLRIRAVGDPAEIDSASRAPVARSIRFDVLRPITFSGRLGVKVVNLNTQSILLDSVRYCSVGIGADSAYSFLLKFPGGGSYRAQYSFVADSLRDTVRQSAVIAHSPLMRTVPRLIDRVILPAVSDKSIPLPPENIRLSGYLEERIQANLNQRLLRIDESGILGGYLERPGNQEWVNEYVGKYLSAASQAWRYSRDPALKSQMDRIVDVLIACQKDDGYLGTYLPENYWLSWDVWGHKYNMIGLLAYYKVTGFEPALEASKKIGDLLCRTFGKEPGKKNIDSSGAWYGIASSSVLDPMVDLYSLTGDRKYLDFCTYIIDAYEQPTGPRVVSKLLSNQKLNTIAGGKAYELLSNMVGLVKLYRVQGDEKLLRAAEAAWAGVTQGRLYVTGSTSSGEVFKEEHVLPGGSDSFVGEGCATTEWLHFNEELFKISGDAKYMDAVEQTVYNHLLAAQNPVTGGVSYFTPLQGQRNFRVDIAGNCCLASVPRGITSIPEIAFTRNAGNGLSINLYSAGKVDCSIRTREGKDVPVHCDVETRFPENGKVTITLDAPLNSRFSVRLRVPSWSRVFKATVAGKTYTGHPGSYITLDRNWGKNSVINVDCNMTVRLLDGGKSYKNCVAVQRGPQILAMDSGLNAGLKNPEKTRIHAGKAFIKADNVALPVPWIGGQSYALAAKNDQGKPVVVTLVPFADAGQAGGFVRVWLNKK